MQYGSDGIKIRREAETMYQKLMTCLESVREKTDFKPEIALVLGSGLGDFAERIQIEQIIKYTDIEGFPVSTVKGHKGRFVFGYVEKTPVVIMQGRVHYYEGYPMSDVVLPTRLMGLLGAKKLLLTNAAGGANPSFHPGDLMMITDHITTAVPSPLIGPNIDELGTRFPDMSEVYSRSLQDVIRKCAAECGIELKEGVYVQFTGPNYWAHHDAPLPVAALTAHAAGKHGAVVNGGGYFPFFKRPFLFVVSFCHSLSVRFWNNDFREAGGPARA